MRRLSRGRRIQVSNRSTRKSLWSFSCHQQPFVRRKPVFSHFSRHFDIIINWPRWNRRDTRLIMLVVVRALMASPAQSYFHDNTVNIQFRCLCHIFKDISSSFERFRIDRARNKKCLEQWKEIYREAKMKVICLYNFLCSLSRYKMCINVVMFLFSLDTLYSPCSFIQQAILSKIYP